MKTKLKITSILVLATLFGLFSCTDELIQINPNEPTVDSFYQNLNDTEAGVTAIYATMLSHFVLNIEEEAERCGMGFPEWGRPTAATSSMIWYNSVYTNSNKSINSKWEACYQGIFRANQVIEGLQRLEGKVDEVTWTRQMAEARFFRGFFHFNLHSTFNHGAIVIRSAVPKTPKEYNKAISDSATVADFFQEDLRYAYANLPATYDEKLVNMTARITKGTAGITLANSYLYQKKYSEATPIYQDLITNSEYGYGLEYDMDKLFTNAGELNQESIFEVVYSETVNPEGTAWDETSFSNRLGRSGNANMFTPTCWLVWKYKTDPMDTTDPRNYYTNEDGLSVLKNVSLRTQAMIAVVEDEYSDYYDGVTAETMNISWNSFTYYKKYSNHDLGVADEGKTPSGTPWKSGKNVTINRLAEVYINLAECLIKGSNNVQGALNALNAVRARWGLQRLGMDDGSGPDFNNVQYDATSLMEHIMYVEKPLELSAEGNAIRWFDMRRWGIIESHLKWITEQKYYLADYTFMGSEGKEITRREGSLQEGESPKPDTNSDVWDMREASKNYIPELHAYYPLPLNEVLANPNLTNME